MVIVFSVCLVPLTKSRYESNVVATFKNDVAIYLLELMLDIDEESALKEYEFSSMFIKGVTRNTLFPVITELEQYEGRTIQDKVRSYLISCGISEETMESIKTILLEE